MARGFGPVAAGRHIAPPSFAVAAAVIKDAAATCVCASSHAGQLAAHEGVGGRLDDRRQQRCKDVAGGDEVAGEAAVGARLDAPRTGAAAEYAIDLGDRELCRPVVGRGIAVAPLGERPQHVAHTACFVEGGAGAGGLLLCAANECAGALGVEHRRGDEPANKAVKRIEGVEPFAAPLALARARGIVRIHEVEPEAAGHERERLRRLADGV